MGALHEGHLSLLRLSNQTCDATVASIFVNPTQFGPQEDLDQYPRTFERDCQLLDSAGVAAVLVPGTQSMYPDGFSTYVEPPEVAKSLEGICRPGHFRGVTTIVMKLFQCLPATHAFFGSKDYQQLKVIEAMVRDLNVGIEIIAGETIRESDGLALSSRNQFLSDEQRKRALLLSKSLETVTQLTAAGEHNIEFLQGAMRQTLLATGGSDSGHTKGVDKIDYAVVVDAQTLAPISELDRPAVALVAAFVGNTRLIDNRQVRVNSR
jgi:pantoate--beta-alanine ligase